MIITSINPFGLHFSFCYWLLPWKRYHLWCFRLAVFKYPKFKDPSWVTNSLDYQWKVTKRGVTLRSSSPLSHFSGPILQMVPFPTKSPIIKLVENIEFGKSARFIKLYNTHWKTNKRLYWVEIERQSSVRRIKWDASSQLSFGPHSATGSIETSL